MATVTTQADWTGGLEPEIDFMLPGRPEDPEMRESASIWLYEENGAFAFPRIGIEAIGANWDHHRYDANFAFADGRVLFETRLDGETRSPMGADGRPTVLGSGGLAFECLEPFRRWRVTYEGEPIDTTTEQMVDGSIDRARRTAVSFEVDLTMVTPGWTQDNRPEKLAGMTDKQRSDAGLMGYGWRVEHLFRGEGRLTVGGESRDFRCQGSRVHRQSVRPLDTFRGHCWQSAVFPDGRAFGYVAYPLREGESEEERYNIGYVYADGRMYPARATRMPWLTRLVDGDDATLELESELGRTRIEGVTCFNTFKHGIAEMPGFILNQGGARYTWDGQTAYGMIERSSWENQVHA